MHEIFVSIKMAFHNLRSNIGKTILSLLGIVIGVTSVILVLSLGAGVKGFVIGQVEAFGTDIVQVEVKVPKTSKTSSQNASGQVGGTQITTLKVEDAEAIAKLSNIDSWYAGVFSQQIVSFQGKNKQSLIMGFTAGVTEVDKKAEIESGTMFSDEDDKSLKQLAVLGYDVKQYFFGEEDAIGKNIKIKGQTYRVVGTLKKRGSAGFFNFDNTLYIPLRTLQKKIMGVEHVQFAIFKMKDVNKLDLTIQEMTETMRVQHKIENIDDEDFAVNSIAEAKDMLGKVFSTLNILLLALTSISLIVGGVGIMNIMYVAVTERTFEIGLRKAVGARNSNILKQFLFESIFITILGGIIGVLIGFLISQIATIVVARMGYAIKFTVMQDAVLIGFGFSAAVGIIFGYYPALKASKMSPMEALRKE
jgi:putative ABC transport system permease protein